MGRLNKKEIAVIKTVGYFSTFQYPPSLDEIYTFLPIRIKKRELISIVTKLVKQKRLVEKSLSKNKSLTIKNGDRFLYTLPPYSIFFNKRKTRTINSQKKIKKITGYLKLLAFFPPIKLVGLSGTVAMMNARKDDDIDLFIITANNRLWTGRFIALILAQFLSIRRKRGLSKRVKDKVCLNLFFDQKNLSVPGFKKTGYVAHEILQMKPLVNKNQTYEKFIKANKWVFGIFPNAVRSGLVRGGFKIMSISKIRNDKASIIGKFCNWNLVAVFFNQIEFLLKKLQLHFIKKHQTTEIVTDTQLWFHPKDLNEKLSRLENNPKGCLTPDP